ncbi:MAG: hypothetical protein ABSF08_11705 [Candidatus Cybelea sp.]
MKGSARTVVRRFGESIPLITTPARADAFKGPVSTKATLSSSVRSDTAGQGGDQETLHERAQHGGMGIRSVVLLASVALGTVGAGSGETPRGE